MTEFKTTEELQVLLRAEQRRLSRSHPVIQPPSGGPYLKPSASSAMGCYCLENAMRRPSIRENNELLNAFDYDQHYRNTEAKLKLEEPELWAYVMQVRGPEGEQPILALPKPGDTIRDNTSGQQLRVVRVYEAWGSISIEAKTLDRNATSYFNGYRLEGGRLLGAKYTPGMAGHNIYNQGQCELFILKRAYQVMPHGRRAVMQAMPDLFA